MHKRLHLAPSRSQLAHLLDTTMGAVDVKSLGYYTVVFVSCDSVGVDSKSTSSFETEDVFQGELFFTLGEGTGHVNRVGIPPDTT